MDFRDFFLNTRMLFTEPREAFKRISLGESFTPGIVILVLLGIVMGLALFLVTPAMEKDSIHGIGGANAMLLSSKIGAFLMPLWCIVFWLIFTILLRVSIQWLRGYAEFGRILLCTSFLGVPLLGVEIILFPFGFLKEKLGFLATIEVLITLVVGGWMLYLLTIMVSVLTDLPPSHSAVAVVIACFFGLMIWFLYKIAITFVLIPILQMFVKPTA